MIASNEITQTAKKLVLAQNRCIAFLGAGISIPPAGTWKELVEKLANACNVPFNNNTQPKDFPDIIDRCIDTNIAVCDQTLRDELPELTNTSRTAIGQIHRFELKAIITTNFDPWIQKNSRESRYPHGIFDYPDLPLNSGLQGRIYYIHGCFNSSDLSHSIDKLILGRKSFEAAYSEDSLLPGFLLNTFVYENVIFIGFNVTEPHISKILRQSMLIRNTIKGGSKPKRFNLVGFDPQERKPEVLARKKDEENEIKALDIEPVHFDNTKGDYSGIEELLDSWVKERDIGDREAPFKTGFDD